MIEFILQKFMVEAEHNPFTCALQLFGEMPVKGEEGYVKSRIVLYVKEIQITSLKFL